jgi:putative membrane protein
MQSRRLITVAVLLAPVAFASGCKMFRPINPNAPSTKTATSEPAAAPAAATKAPTTKAAPRPVAAREARAGLSDPNIAAMVLAANNTDISYARIALAPTRENSATRAERPDVRAFAQRMLTDHTGVNGLVNDLLTKLNVAPEENTASLDFRDESANKRDAMRDLSGYAFDSTYIENEVAYHVKFLATIDSVLIPASRNAELKALLTAVRPAVAAHLAHAEQVRANVLAKK